MPIGGAPEQGFYTGGGLSAEVPHLFPVAIDGVGYLLDLEVKAFKRQSIQLLRQQADNSSQPGESSINPEDLWRRFQQSWHQGAGQTHLDRNDSSPSRFRRSKGIDVWTKWSLGLLNEATLRRASVATNQALIVAGSRLYVVDGASILFTTDLAGYTAVTGLPGTVASSITSDGYTIFTAHGANGIYTSNRGISVFSSWATGNVSLVAYIKGRLMAAQANILYNPTVAGALPAPLYTHPNADFTWVGFAEGPGQIYAAGYSGDKSLIYRTAIRPDGTALDVPVLAGELPDGEVVRSIQGYLGFVLIGTDKGVRFAMPDGQGSLTLGQLINIGASVRWFEPQDRFVWFGWTNYDGTSTGLGRLDLSVFTAPLTPAYASDLMAPVQGVIGGVVTFLDKRAFVVQSSGLWAESANKVAIGTLESGQMTFGIPDPKVAMYLQARHTPLTGTVRLAVALDGGAFLPLGSGAQPGSTETVVPANQMTGEKFEIQTTLERAADFTQGPTLTRYTLRTYPGPNRGEMFMVPLIFRERVELRGGIERGMDPREHLNKIRGLIKDHRLVPYQEGHDQFSVFVEDYEWLPDQETQDGTFWNGTCIVRLKSVAEF